MPEQDPVEARYSLRDHLIAEYGPENFENVKWDDPDAFFSYAPGGIEYEMDVAARKSGIPGLEEVSDIWAGGIEFGRFLGKIEVVNKAIKNPAEYAEKYAFPTLVSGYVYGEIDPSKSTGQKVDKYGNTFADTPESRAAAQPGQLKLIQDLSKYLVENKYMAPEAVTTGVNRVANDTAQSIATQRAAGEGLSFKSAIGTLAPAILAVALPGIGSALTSAFTGTLGATGAAIASGATIGAGTSALMGGDPLKGALVGGITSGAGLAGKEIGSAFESPLAGNLAGTTIGTIGSGIATGTGTDFEKLGANLAGTAAGSTVYGNTDSKTLSNLANLGIRSLASGKDITAQALIGVLANPTTFKEASKALSDYEKDSYTAARELGLSEEEASEVSSGVQAALKDSQFTQVFDDGSTLTSDAYGNPVSGTDFDQNIFNVIDGIGQYEDGSKLGGTPEFTQVFDDGSRLTSDPYGNPIRGTDSDQNIFTVVDGVGQYEDGSKLGGTPEMNFGGELADPEDVRKLLEYNASLVTPTDKASSGSVKTTGSTPSSGTSGGGSGSTGSTDTDGSALNTLLAMGLGGALGFLGSPKDTVPVVGYQGGVPEFTATRVPGKGVTYTPKNAAEGGLMNLYDKNTPVVMMAGGGGVSDIPQTHEAHQVPQASQNLVSPASQAPQAGIANIPDLNQILAAAQKASVGKSTGSANGIAYLVSRGYDPTEAISLINSNADMAKFAKGGISDLGSYTHAKGGRMLKGPGDGMSDSIPADIDGKRPARLATDEFVIPADVVSHLGNGSSDAGAKVLYDMMAKIRKARTGNAKQGKKINPKKFVPA